MKLILLLLVFFIPFKSTSQMTELEFYKKMDSLNKEMIYYQFKNDSLKNIMIDRLEKNDEKKTKEIKRNRVKNFILGISLTMAIIIISVIQ